MRIFEVQIPVGRMPGINQQEQRDAKSLAMEMVNSLHEAAVALWQFDEAQAFFTSDEYRLDPFWYEKDPVPQEYRQALPALHAKSCIYALDNIGKCLQRLRQLPTLGPTFEGVAGAFADSFPTLVKVRNSAHHSEDRAQGKRLRRGKSERIELGVETAGQLFVGNLFGSSYGGTTEDGVLAAIEISESTVSEAQSIVQMALNAMPFDGLTSTQPFDGNRP